ncbi:hypothetical protein PG985_007788 [Apiospora marii]|uniref:uncharacterized protein n=1 Tax=Apiospora marii TaxID=335849 RepID=UPI00312D6433
MMDPLSGLGSVAGLVSLGFTVVDGIAKYVNAIAARSEELESTRRRNEVLRRTIAFVDGVLSQQGLSHQQKFDPASVDETVESCKKELVNLENFVVELSGCDSTFSWRSKLRDTRKKLTYAFERPRVEQLATKLDRTVQVIQLALHGLELLIGLWYTNSDLSRLQLSKLDAIDNLSRKTASEVKGILPSVQEGLGQMEQRLAASVESVKSTGLKENQETRKALVELESSVVSQLAKRLMATDSSQAFSWLASKPAALKELFEETSKLQILDRIIRNANTEAKSPASSRGSGICVCGYRQSFQKRNTLFGPFRIYRETCVRVHEPYCVLSQVRLTQQRIVKFEIQIYALVCLMHIVLTISFHVSSGAGGHSMSPTFAYHPTVDRKSDRAFQIIDDIPSAYMKHRIHCRSRCSSCMISIYKMALKGLEGLVLAGKASPKAVDAQNQSWLHATLNLFKGFVVEDDHGENVYLPGILELGVPPSS